MDNEVKKWSSRNIQAIKEAMAMPDCLDALELGKMKKDYNTNPEKLTKEKIENWNKNWKLKKGRGQKVLQKCGHVNSSLLLR